MIELERIKSALGDRDDLDLDAIYDEYRKLTVPDLSLVEFVTRSGDLDGAAIAALHLASELEVTHFDGLSTRTHDALARTVDSAVLPVAEESEPGQPVTGDHVAAMEPTDDRFNMLGVVGEGGMGVVHVAKDLDLRRKVAFKRLTERAAQKPISARRFLNEVQITAQLDHPNVIPVYSLEVASDGTPAYSMKLVHGKTVRDILDEASARAVAGQPPLEENGLDDRLEILIKVCDGLAYAHDKGVIHRDLKPDNIMVGRFGEVYIMDWGLARLMSEPDALVTDAEIEPGESIEVAEGDGALTQTREGSLVGTPAFMAPEQAEGLIEKMGPWSDVYTLGAILFQFVYLRRHYIGESALHVIRATIEGELAPFEPAHESLETPPELAAIIRRATAKAPADRYQDAADLAADLRRYRAGEETVAWPDNGPRRVRRWLRAHPRTVATTIVLLVIAVVSFGVWREWVEEARRHEERQRAAAQQQATAAFFGEVSARAQRIDNHFLFYEAALHGLAANAVYAMGREVPPTSVATYRNSAYMLPETAPPGMTESERYGKPIHASTGVFQVPSSEGEESWKDDLQRLASLVPTLQEMFAVDPDGTVATVDPVALQARIANETVPVIWGYVALESNGLVYMYPGAEGFAAGYDARLRPWYRFGKSVFEAGKQRRVRDWSKPYLDLMDQGLVISAVEPMVTTSGEFLGVAVLDLGFAYVRDHYMQLEGRGGIVGAYLLNREGLVMIKTSADDADDPYAGKHVAVDVVSTFDFGPFGHSEVLASVAREDSGYIKDEIDAGPVYIGWARLEHLGWTFVTVIEAAEIEP